MKTLLAIAFLIAANTVFADTNATVIIRISKTQYRTHEPIMLEVIHRPTAIRQEDQMRFNNLVMGKGTIVVMSGATTIQRTEMSPIQAPNKGPDGWTFFHSVGVQRRSHTPNFAPGKYMVFVELDSWRSNEQEFQVQEEK